MDPWALPMGHKILFMYLFHGCMFYIWVGVVVYICIYDPGPILYNVGGMIAVE